MRFSNVTSGFCLSVCLVVAPHFFQFPYVIYVEGLLRGRHPLRISCILKMGTMKARVRIRVAAAAVAGENVCCFLPSLLGKCHGWALARKKILKAVNILNTVKQTYVVPRVYAL